jgi:hypothetical protein
MPTATDYSPPITTAEYRDVKQVVRQVILDEPGGVEAWRLAYTVARVGWDHDCHQHPGRKFEGQCKRAANELTDEGVVRKVGRGDKWPSGYTSTQVFWYSPEAWQRVVTKAEEDRASDRVEAHRWDLVAEALTARGVPHSRSEGRTGIRSVDMDLDGFEALLGLSTGR